MNSSVTPNQWKGQARVGWLTTQGPGCGETLVLDRGYMKITSRLGDFQFTPQTVFRIERSGFFPWLWTGIVIRHRASNYPERIGFWPRGVSTRGLLDQLKSRGFPVT